MEAVAPMQPGSPAAETRRDLLWPLRPRPLLVLLTVAGLGLVTVIPVLGPALALALAAALAHTGFRALDHTALHGRPDAEPLALGPDGDCVVRSVGMLLAMMAWAALALLLWAFGGIAGGLAGAGLLATVAPAVILRIGREHGLTSGLVAAVNPAALVGIARTVGRPYLRAAGLPLAVAALAGGSLALFGHRLPLPGFLALAFLAGGYTTLLAFRLAACLAADHRERLGYLAKRPRPSPPPAPEPAEPSLDEQVRTLVKADRIEEAANLLRQQVASQPTDLASWERYYRLLGQLGQDGPLLAASKGFITALLLANQEGRALEVMHAALNRDRGFRPAKPEQVFRLARAARRDDRPGLALRIMDGFAKAHPAHPDAPMVLLFAARIAGEDFRKPDQASRLLDSLLRAYADHPLAGEARRLRQTFRTAS
jgi:hypothetical protein